MNFREYQENAKRTDAPLEGIKHDIHMVMGIITETSELLDVFKKNMAYGKPIDWVNVQEELADTMWYVANYFNDHNLDLESLQIIVRFPLKPDDVPVPEFNEYTCLRLSAIAGNLANVFEKNITYGRDINRDGIIQEMLSVVFYVMSFCNVNGIDIYKILETNIEKLKKRFPEKFDTEKAINRDTDWERKILEG